jgi:hypothetical protein
MSFHSPAATARGLMKITFGILTLLIASQAVSQTATAPPSPPASQPSVAADVSPAPVTQDGAVITVNGACPLNKSKDSSCQTVVTRAEFERLMAVLSRQRNGESLRSIPPDAKRQLAVQYSQLLLFAALAEQQGLQDTPEAKELVDFLHLQAMSEELSRSMLRKSAPTEVEVRNYYDQHREDYTRFDLERISLPLREKVSAQPGSKERTKLADDLRERALHGESFAALQNEAFAKLGMKNPPKIEMVVMPGSTVPQAHAAIYRLKPGDVSPVIEDASGIYIYKLKSREAAPLSQSHASIQQLLSEQKAQEALQKLIETNKITLNSSYFEPAHELAAHKSSVQSVPSGTR